jgi:hypothetical protein
MALDFMRKAPGTAQQAEIFALDHQFAKQRAQKSAAIQFQRNSTGIAARCPLQF